MQKIEVNTITNYSISPDAPFGVELLIDCDKNDPTKGYSEMSWFETKEAQNDYVEELKREYKI